MELKTTPIEFKADLAKREITGYASIFGNVDVVGDVVLPGAFAKTLAEDFPQNRIKYFWNHMQPIGRLVHAEEDSKGLLTVGRISKTSLGNDVLAMAEDAVFSHMSFGYDTIASEMAVQGSKQVRLLKELKLWEVSPVLWPANPETSILSVKSEEQLDELLRPFRAFIAQLEALRGKAGLQMSLLKEPDRAPEVQANASELLAALKGRIQTIQRFQPK